LSTEETQIQRLDSAHAADYATRGIWTRRWEAAALDARLRAVMIVATLLVIPDLILEEQPLRASWHQVAVISDWAIWLVFLVEFLAIMVLAKDWRSWLRRYPLAPAMLILTPPFAPAALQALRVFRLLRLLRVARGFQLLSKLLTLDGLKYAVALAAFLVVGGGTVFADVESHVGHPVSTWDGIWWAIGTVSTEGTHIEATTAAGRAIAIVLMFTGIGVFSILTGAVSQHFITSRPIPRAAELSHGEKAIMARLDELTERLAGVETERSSGMADAEPNSSHG
jgi:voltage-gated potassium channel